MKNKILRLIDNNIAGAEDNSHRARMTFGGRTPEQLDAEYGKSGRKCKEILDEYETALKEANDMKVWFLANANG
ncbi:MAG: hypothetical protein WC236_09795 [Gallionellaceae bacterium]|jgi:hypothetical protein